MILLWESLRPQDQNGLRQGLFSTSGDLSGCCMEMETRHVEQRGALVAEGAPVAEGSSSLGRGLLPQGSLGHLILHPGMDS